MFAPKLNDDNLELLFRSRREASVSSDAKIRTEIKTLTQKKRFGMNPFSLLRYNPGYGLVLIPVFILFILLGFGGYMTRPEPVLAFRSGAGILSGNELSSQTHVKEKDSVRVPDNKICDLRIDKCADFRFFPSSVFTVISMGKANPALIFRLEKGSLYLDKKKDWDNKPMYIEIKDYRFLLQGTRIFAAILQDRILLSCFAGRVKAIRDNGAEYTLLAGEKTEIFTGTQGNLYRIRGWLNEDDVRFDENSLGFPPFDAALSALYSSICSPKTSDGIGREQGEVPKQKGTIREQTPDNPPYAATEIGSIKNSFSDTRTNLIFSASDADRGYILCQNKLYTIRDNSVKEALSFDKAQVFKIKPVISGDKLCLVSSRNIYLIDRNSFVIRAMIPLKSNEAVIENHLPQFDGKMLYVPAQNTGYYAVNSDEPQPAAKLFFKEKFPLTPIPTDSGILFGSSYPCSIAFLDKKGNRDWTLPVDGESYSDFIKADDHIYYPVFKDNKSYIVQVDEKGKIEKYVPLAEQVLADLFAYKHRLFGFYKSGLLFSVDTGTGITTDIDKVFNTLTLEKWRASDTFRDGKLLYAGTDTGELLVYDMETGKKVYRFEVKAGETFSAAPVFVGGTLFMVADSGRVFTLVKNAR
jgi:hypothetical protein